MSSATAFNENSRKLVTRVVFGFILFTLLVRFFSYSLLSQLQAPVLRFPYVDLSYWIVHLLGLPELITSNFALALSFDLGMMAFAFLAAYFHKQAVWPILFGLSYLLYILTYNTYSGHHTHCMAGIFYISIPFWFRNLKAFSLVWEGVRFYTLFIYGSAFLWKLLRGALFHSGHGLSIFMNENTSYLVQQPDTIRADLYWYLISHPGLADGLVLVGALLQGMFLAGFFTRKLDWLFFLLPIAFHSMTFILFHVLFYELLILNLVFLPWNKLAEKASKVFSSR